MTTPLEQARLEIQQARAALGSGDRRLARQLAEHASKLAPQLEDPWLVLAAVAGPRLGLEYIQRALQINPNSERARRGMEWVMQRLRDPAKGLGDTQETPAAKRSGTQPVRARVPSGRPAAARRARRSLLLPLLLLSLGCIIIVFAGWTAMSSPVVASMLAPPVLASEPTQSAQWAHASIPKPAYAAPVPGAELVPLSTPTPQIDEVQAGTTGDLSTDPSTALSTDFPTAAPTEVAAEPEVPTEDGPWTGTFSMEVVQDTPTPEAPPYVPPTAAPAPGEVTGGVHWIDVDLSQQMVYAYAGDTVVNSFLVSTGTWLTPTVTGKFKVWIKLRYSDMSGPDYYLPNVPYVMYFYKDYGLHGTYWHNNFGTPMSHGCVNLSIPDAEWLYNFAYEGTVVNVHY